MFGIGMPELLVILAVALIFIGPKKLPDLAKSLGKALGEFKRATNDLKQSLEQEAGLDEVRKSFTETRQELQRSLDPEEDRPVRSPDADSGNPGDPVAAESPTAPHADADPTEPSAGTPPGEWETDEPRQRTDDKKGDPP